MPNLPISGLNASAANLTATDLLPVVQTSGVGPVKMTGLQLAGGLLGSTALTGATVTTSKPVLDLSQTWNAGAVTFTGLKFNATDTASASGSLLLDIGTGGGSYTSQFSITKGGVTKTANYFDAQGNARFTASSTIPAIRNGGGALVAQFQTNWTWLPDSIAWGGSGDGVGQDAFIRRAAAATLQLGAADANSTATVTITIAAPGVVTWSSHGLTTGSAVEFTTTGALPTGITAGTTYYAIVVDANTFQIASSEANAFAGTAITTSGSQSGTHTGYKGAISQALKVQSVSAGVSNLGGSPLRIQGSQGTGTGAGGSIIFQVAPAGSSGTAVNALATALTIDSTKRVSFSAQAFVDQYGSIATGGSGSGLYVKNVSGDNTGRWLENAGIQVASDHTISWSNATTIGTADTTLTRAAAGVLKVAGASSAGGAVQFNGYTYATLPTKVAGMIVYITDGSAAYAVGDNITAGGGTNKVYAYTDGTNWKAFTTSWT